MNRRRADSFFSGNYIPHMDRVSGERKNGEGDYVAYIRKIRTEERKEWKSMLYFPLLF